jgi:hypothetical protein
MSFSRINRTRHRRVALSAAFAVVTASLAVVPAGPASAGDPTVRTQIFNYTGGSQSFVVPPRIKVVAFNLFGGSGGAVGGGQGGQLTGLILTTPGETLVVTPGGSGGNFVAPAGGFNGGGSGGTGDYNGGGGGGASDIRGAQGVIAVAGGGGGGANISGGVGGAGGALVGSPGTDGLRCGSSTNPVAYEDPAQQADHVSTGGGGGDPLRGGGAGGTSTGNGSPGGSGGRGSGGSGGTAGPGGYTGGGGGGGGYYGGGGGAGGFDGSLQAALRQCTGGGGGGGSSFFGLPAVAVTAQPGVWPLAGHAVFSWLDDGGPTPVVVQGGAPQNKFVGQAASVTATVLDQDGRPLSGRTVTFERTGANPGTTSAVTNGIGVATTTYVGARGGVDAIQASTPTIGGVTVSGATAVAWVGELGNGTPSAVGKAGFNGTASLPTFPCPPSANNCDGTFSGDWQGTISGFSGPNEFTAAWATTTGGITATFDYWESSCLAGTETILGGADGRGSASTKPGEAHGTWKAPGEMLPRNVIGVSITFEFLWDRVVNGAVLSLSPVSLTLNVEGLGPRTVLTEIQLGEAVFVPESSDNTPVPSCLTPLQNVHGRIAGTVDLIG